MTSRDSVCATASKTPPHGRPLEHAHLVPFPDQVRTGTRRRRAARRRSRAGPSAMRRGGPGTSPVLIRAHPRSDSGLAPVPGASSTMPRPHHRWTSPGPEGAPSVDRVLACPFEVFPASLLGRAEAPDGTADGPARDLKEARPLPSRIQVSGRAPTGFESAPPATRTSPARDQQKTRTFYGLLRGLPRSPPGPRRSHDSAEEGPAWDHEEARSERNDITTEGDGHDERHPHGDR